MSNKPKSRYSTIEFLGSSMTSYITKWTHKPKYEYYNGIGYFASSSKNFYRDGVISEPHARIEQTIRDYSIRLYGDDSQESTTKFENEVLSRFVSNKVSIDSIEKDFYEFLEREFG